MTQTLEELRKIIDRIDTEILTLLHERAKVAKSVGKLKKNKGTEFHVPERERTVLERLVNLNNSSQFPNKAVETIFREVMSACLSLERPIKVAYLGPGQTYSFLALQKVFGSSAVGVPHRSLESVFSAIEKREVDYSIVPLENSAEGYIQSSIQLLTCSQAHIHGEIRLPVHHCLASRARSMDEIEEVYSHPQALQQCKSWLAKYLPKARLIEASSTAAGCEIAQFKPTAAAISNVTAIEAHELHILRKDIQDQVGNSTRFLVLSDTKKMEERKDDKTTLVLTLDHTSGQLAKILQIFAENEVNLLGISTVPFRETPWKVSFWFDIEGSLKISSKVGKSVEAVRGHVQSLKVLGTYTLLK